MTRRLARQGASFLVVGGAQLLLDWGVFSSLHVLTGLTLATNVAGRMAGAGLGFWLNGRFTFAADGEQRLGTRRFVRYLALWTTLTAISTLGMGLVDRGLAGSAVYWCKPLIEATLSIASFFVSRHWVYE